MASSNNTSNKCPLVRHSSLKTPVTRFIPKCSKPIFPEDRNSSFLSNEELTQMIQRIIAFENQLNQNNEALKQTIRKKENELQNLNLAKIKLEHNFQELKNSYLESRHRKLQTHCKALESIIAAQTIKPSSPVIPSNKTNKNDNLPKKAFHNFSLDFRTSSLNDDVSSLNIAIMIASKKIGDHASLIALKQRVKQIERLMKHLNEENGEISEDKPNQTPDYLNDNQ